MVKIPEDISSGLKKLSEAVNVPLKSLLDRMKEILEENETIKSIGDSEKEKEFKIRVAWAVLYSEHSARGKSEDYLITPIFKPNPREVKIKGDMTWVGDVTALVQKLSKQEDGSISKGPITYAHGTFWREGAKNLSKLEKGKTYKAQVVANESKSGWGMTIGSDKTGFVATDDKMDFQKYFDTEILPKNISISLSELDLNKSDDVTDIRIIRATVADANVAEKEGREYGFYIVMDDTIIGTNQRFFVNPSEVCWRKGSILYFGGIIERNDNDESRFTVQFIVPTDLAMPEVYSVVSTPKKQVVQETVDINMDTETSEKPVNKSETSGSEFEI